MSQPTITPDQLLQAGHCAHCGGANSWLGRGRRGKPALCPACWDAGLRWCCIGRHTAPLEAFGHRPQANKCFACRRLPGQPDFAARKAEVVRLRKRTNLTVRQIARAVGLGLTATVAALRAAGISSDAHPRRALLPPRAANGRYMTRGTSRREERAHAAD